MIALVDCNNFYASCERLFRPELINKPVVVLSNNDGCVIARSNESKALGIKMGLPYYQLKELPHAEDIVVFSSNYTLYGSISNRVHGIFRRYVNLIEDYSIDEAFLDFADVQHYFPNLENSCLELRSNILKEVGIPTCIGIASTKALAKAANKYAKKKTPSGVFLCHNETNRQIILEWTDIGDVWGIGRQYAQALKEIGITNAWQFAQLPEKYVLQKMTVVGHRLWKELNGVSCIEMEIDIPDKKNMIVSRSFPNQLSTYEELQNALYKHVDTLAMKLRRQQQCTAMLGVFVHTNRFRMQDKQYYGSRTISLLQASNNTVTLMKAADYLLKRIFKNDLKYKKCGVEAFDLCPENAVQGSLFATPENEKSNKVMEVMDAINIRYGNKVARMASYGWQHKAHMLREHLSPSYTTEIKEILCIKI